MSNVPAKFTAVQILGSQDTRAAIQRMLPPSMSIERFLRIAESEIKSNPILLQCDPASVVRSVSDAAKLGLEVGKHLGQAFLIPRKDKQGVYQCSMQRGYKGLIKQVRESNPDITLLTAEAVYDDDLFDCELGTEPKIRHKPGRQRKTLTDVYAVCRMKNSDVPFIAVMSYEQIEEHRKKWTDSRSNAWADAYDEMAKKTVLTKLIKYLPITLDEPEVYEPREELPPAKADIDKFKAIAAAPDSVEPDKAIYLKQVEELFEQAHAKKVVITDLVQEDISGLPAAQLVALISILKERLA